MNDQKYSTPQALGNLIAEFVFSKRTELNITQEHLANCLGMSQSNYSKMEKGYVPFSLAEIEVIAKEFYLTLPVFFFQLFGTEYNLLETLSAYLKALPPKDQKHVTKRVKREFQLHANMLANSILLFECLSRLELF